MRPKEQSAPTSRFATCDWYYHGPLKHETKSEVSHPPTSQVPGLSDLAEPHNDLMTGSRKKWIRDTDSDYVKLAKQGGRPDLLKHMTSVSKKTPQVSHAPPDWYTYEDVSPPPGPAIAPLRNVPDYMIHEEFDKEDSEQTYEARKGPFDFDQKTIWQRESEEYEKENHHNKKVKLPAIKQDNNVTTSGKGPPPTKADHGRSGKKCFFPPMPGTDGVNFSKLLSNGYGDDWHRHHTEHETKATQKSKTFKNFG